MLPLYKIVFCVLAYSQDQRGNHTLRNGNELAVLKRVAGARSYLSGNLLYSFTSVILQAGNHQLLSFANKATQRACHPQQNVIM